MSILKIRDASGKVYEILAIKGEDGKNYVLTEADKREIASMVAANVVSLTEPAKVSAFENDAGYLTETQVQNMIKDAIANIQGGENEVAAIISFSIEDYGFQAEEGMTWREWVNSEYNSDGACVYNEGEDTIRFVEYSLDVLSPSSTPVKGSDSIISGYFYYLS